MRIMKLGFLLMFGFLFILLLPCWIGILLGMGNCIWFVFGFLLSAPLFGVYCKYIVEKLNL